MQTWSQIADGVQRACNKKKNTIREPLFPGHWTNSSGTDDNVAQMDSPIATLHALAQLTPNCSNLNLSATEKGFVRGKQN